MVEIVIVLIAFLLVAAAAVATLVAVRQARRRGLHRWLGPYLRTSRRRRQPRAEDEIHVLLCVGDHYEPCWGRVSEEIAAARVENWAREYPRLFTRFRDSDGRSPRHTFFYPQEEYQPQYLDALAELCRQGFGEVEIHLHHDNDTADGLRDKLLAFKEILVERHGLLARRPDTGAVTFGFIHGNWGLCNGRPDGRFCGVNDELTVLRESGCYADFTFPSAPHPSQPGKLNSIYYAQSRPDQPGGHNHGWDIATGPVPEDVLLLIQGPLLFDWRGRWSPRVENGCLQESQPPTMARLDNWLKAGVQVPTRPDWFFVKLHAHGAQERSQTVLLGEPMVRFHEELAKRARQNPSFHYHYVTAREMYNLAKAAEAGWKGCVRDALDYELTWNGSCLAAR